MDKVKKDISPEKRDQLLETLKTRFEKKYGSP